MDCLTNLTPFRLLTTSSCDVDQIETGMVMINGISFGFELQEGVTEPVMTFWGSAGYGMRFIVCWSASDSLSCVFR